MNTRQLPVPPTVPQRTALGPDGLPDTANVTDCGEACVSAALEGLRLLEYSPACVRQSLGLPAQLGTSNASEIVGLMTKLGVVATAATLDGVWLWKALARLRHHGRYCLLLGDWISPGSLHWVLAYERDALSVFVMDPWTGELQSYSRDVLAVKGVASQVFLT